jgi:hypothetical protein
LSAALAAQTPERAPHFDVRRPRTREKVSQSECPNFKSAGRSVERPLLDVLHTLQAKHGDSWASEAGLRWMVARNTGRMPGVDTIRFALRRLEQRGVVVQRHLLPGGMLPDGCTVCLRGTRLVRLPVSRIPRHARAVTREQVTGHVQRRMLAALRQTKHAAMKAPEPEATKAEQRRELDARRRQALLDAAAWAELNDPDWRKGRPPPS